MCEVKIDIERFSYCLVLNELRAIVSGDRPHCSCIGLEHIDHSIPYVKGAFGFNFSNQVYPTFTFGQRPQVKGELITAFIGAAEKAEDRI